MRPIKELTAKTILEDEVFDELFDVEDEIDQARRILALEERARELEVWDKFKPLLAAAKRMAKKIRSGGRKSVTKLENWTNFDGPYDRLRCRDWIADDDGIYLRNPNTGISDILACYHPILPLERLRNVETGEEQVKIAFCRNNRWEEFIVPKTLISSANKIVSLSSRGVAVTSENAKFLVRYLADVENSNEEYIPIQYSTSKLGWTRNDGFLPYDSDIVFDGDARFRQIAESIGQHGDREAWYEHARKVRAAGRFEVNFMLAAAFSSILVKKLGALPYFVDLWGETEGGKAQPLDTKIITPSGYKLMGDIGVGDEVIGEDGKPYKVSGVYPQGIKEVFKVSFEDGTSTRCCKEHLWKVMTITRRNHGRGYMVTDLQKMMGNVKAGKSFKYRIPVTKPVNFRSTSDLRIDPYLLGVLIGDGCTCSKRPVVYFNNSEQDVIERVKERIEGIGGKCVRNYHSTNQYVISRVPELIRAIRQYGLNVKSPDKFIPIEYLRSDIQSRKMLLAGLFDTDGSVCKKSYKYSTTSSRLASDIRTLCQSLGYRASVRIKKRVGKSIEYTLNIFANVPIYLSEKHALRDVKGNRTVDRSMLAITDIEYVGPAECQCIMVDSKDHTYLCDDFIVTHNTVCLMLAASVWANPDESAYIKDYKGTEVGLEAISDLLNHLPLILDDTSKKNRRIEENFEGLVYDLCSGKGKTRSNKEIGLNRESHWKNCILTNGERPLNSYVSQGGAINRILEVQAGSVLFDSPRETAETVKKHYGFAGRDFVELIRKVGDKELLRLQKELMSELMEENKMQKQALSLSVILTADKLITEHLFRDGRYLSIEEAKTVLIDRNELSDNERCYEYLLGKIAMNPGRFDPENDKVEIWGIIENNIAFIQSNAFADLCSSGGFSRQSFLKWANDRDLLDTGSNGDRYTKTKRVNGRVVRGVSLRLKEEKEDEFVSVTKDFEQYGLPFY